LIFQILLSMTPNKTTNSKNIDQLKKELDIMHKLFDNLKSKNKKNSELKDPIKEKKQKFRTDDNIIFNTPTLPKITPKSKSEVSLANIQKKESDSEKIIKDNLSNVSQKKLENKLEEQIENSNSNTPLITIEFDNEELKSMQNTTIAKEEIVAKTIIESDKNVLSKKEVLVKRDTELKKESTQEIDKPTINKEESIRTTKPQKQIDEETQESYLSIKEKLEKIKADIKERELLREQKSQITTTITKIVEKNKANSKKLKSVTTTTLQPNKTLDTTKTEIKTETSLPTNILTKNKEQKSPNPKGDTIKTKKETAKITEIKKLQDKNTTNKFSKVKEVKHKNVTSKNNAVKKGTTLVKANNNKLDVLSITILVLIIVVLLVFWYLYIK